MKTAELPLTIVFLLLSVYLLLTYLILLPSSEKINEIVPFVQDTQLLTSLPNANLICQKDRNHKHIKFPQISPKLAAR